MEEATLIRFIDGQVDVREREWIRLHCASCSECADALTSLERMSQAVHSLFRSTDDAVTVPPFESVRSRLARSVAARAPQHSWRRYAVAAGVGAILLLAAAPPVRALVGSLIARLRAPAPPAAAPVIPSRPDPEFTHSLIEFEPNGNELVVDFQSRDAGTVVRVAAHDKATAVLRTTAGSSDDVTVLPSGLRVTGLSGTLRDYRLTVPATLGSVVVRISGRPALVTTGRDLLLRERRVDSPMPER